MKRIFFFACMFAALVATNTAAQDTQGLDLSDAQRQQIQELLQSNRAETNAAIANILTEAQKDAIVARAITGQFQRRGTRARAGARATAGARGQRARFARNRGLQAGRIADALDLTDEQREQIQSIVAEKRAEGPEAVREAIREVLTAEQAEKFDEMQKQQRRTPRRASRGRR